PLQPQGLARTGAGRDAHVDFTVDRRHRHLAAEHRFIKRDRQIDQYIPALAAEEGARPDLDGDIRTDRGPAIQPRTALAPQPDTLPGAEADGHADVKRDPARHREAPLRAARRFQEIDGEVIMRMLPADGA